jgi:hypothetical protein
MEFWTQGLRDLVIFGLGWSAGAFVAWQVWVYHCETIRQIQGNTRPRRRASASAREKYAAGGMEARTAKEGREHSWERN